jgi:methionyl-tRNA formyltransferase
MPTIIFMGTPEFSVSILEKIHQQFGVSLVISQPDKPVGRKRVLTAPPVAEKAASLGIDLYQPERIKDSEALEKIAAYQPDIIITAAYGQILPKALLDVPRLGAVNVHASLLPKHRGGAPIHRAILNGDKESGVTIMYMAEGLDSGDTISQVRTPIMDNDNTGSLHDRLSELGGELLIKTLPDIFNGTNARTPQNEDDKTVSPNISKADEKLDFNQVARTVFNHIRGLSPSPGAYTMLDDKRLKIYAAELVEGTSKGIPGTIIKKDDSGFYVAVKDGILLITEVQPSGKKKMAARDYANSRPDIIGKKLGNE